MKQDVIHTEDLLVINIRENDCRGLKTENSKRSLPVVSDSATKALQKLLEAQSDSPYLFPRYASCGYLNNTGHQLRSVITSRSPLTVRPPTA